MYTGHKDLCSFCFKFFDERGGGYIDMKRACDACISNGEKIINNNCPVCGADLPPGHPLKNEVEKCD